MKKKGGSKLPPTGLPSRLRSPKPRDHNSPKFRVVWSLRASFAFGEGMAQGSGPWILRALGCHQCRCPWLEAVEQQTFPPIGRSRGEVQQRSCGTADVGIISIIRCRWTIAAGGFAENVELQMRFPLAAGIWPFGGKLFSVVAVTFVIDRAGGMVVTGNSRM